MVELQQRLRKRAVRLYAFSRAWLRIASHPLETAKALLHPSLGRAFPNFARDTRPVLVKGTAGVVGAGLAVRRFAPRLLLPAMAGLVAAVGAERWRTSELRGRRHHWPPGPRGTTPLPWVDPDHFADRATRYGPVFSSNFFTEPMACVMGNARAMELLKDNADALRHSSLNYFAFIPGGSFRDKSGVQHKLGRAALASGLTPRLVEALAPRLRAEFDALFREMAAVTARDGSAPPRDFVAATMFRVWQYVFFALDLDAAGVDAMRDHYSAARLMTGGPREGAGKRAEAGLQAIEAAIRANLRPSVDAGDPPDCLLTEMMRRQPDILDDPHLLRVLIYLSNTSSRDMTGLLTWLFKHMADNPSWLDRLRAADGPDAVDPGVGSLADHVVSETLRMEQSEYINVVATDDIHFGGYTVPEGWNLRMCVHENHRDPTVFDQPDAYRPQRWADRKFTRQEYSPFGLDDHSCLGEALARSTGRVFLQALAAWHIRVVEDGPREFHSGYHFAPNPRFRVALTARTAQGSPSR